MKKIIYDVGSNNGDDIPYYLMKGDIVVAIEANPGLCEGIRQRFADDIRAGRLILESCVVTAEETSGEVSFYLHNTEHVLSQFPKPLEAALDQFTRIRLPSKSILSIIRSYGSPYYVKIDIEHYDTPLLKALFADKIYPPFISAESHSLEVFLTLVYEGRYEAFKLVDGSSVSRVYADRLIESQSTQEHIRYSFPFHSAGPFGNDIDGQWMTTNNFFRLLAFAGLGWKDIHATNIEVPDPSAQPRAVDYLDQLSRDELLIQARQAEAYHLQGMITELEGQLQRTRIALEQSEMVSQERHDWIGQLQIGKDWLENQLKLTQAALEQAQTLGEERRIALEQAEAVSEERRIALEQAEAVSEEHRIALEQAEAVMLRQMAEITRKAERIERLKSKKQNLQLLLEQQTGELHEFRKQIEIMENSKFWRLRKRWLKIKQSFGG